MQPSEQDLRRGLGQRQIQLMALGAAIGVGLFFGSAHTIRMAGPSIILSYMLCGAIVFLIMRALGEMAVHNPVAGSFSRYAKDYLGPLAGYLTGWNYWLLWLVSCIAEITAVGVYMGIWFPDVPRWIWALCALSSMGAVNLLSVKVFGEFEFWFSLIKVVAIILMIAAGFGMIVFGFGNSGVATGISNLWTHGGFFPFGAKGMLMSLQMVTFAYLGVEMVGVTAGEASSPHTTIPKAVNSIFWRILIFYGGSLFVILSIYPWNQVGVQGSPFVTIFAHTGIRRTAGIINFVVLTAALSTCNGGIFSTGRMLYSLAQQGHAPRAFAATTRTGVPYRAIIVSMGVLAFGVLMNYLAPDRVFTWATAISTFCGIWTWCIILITQIRFRASLPPEQKNALAFRMPFWPYGSWFALAFLMFVIVLMGYFPDTRIALIVGPALLALLTMLYFVLRLAPDAGEEVSGGYSPGRAESQTL